MSTLKNYDTIHQTNNLSTFHIQLPLTTGIHMHTNKVQPDPYGIPEEKGRYGQRQGREIGVRFQSASQHNARPFNTRIRLLHNTHKQNCGHRSESIYNKGLSDAIMYMGKMVFRMGVGGTRCSPLFYGYLIVGFPYLCVLV